MVVRNRLALGIAIDEQGVVTQRLNDIGPVIGILVIVRVARFIDQKFAAMRDDKLPSSAWLWLKLARARMLITVASGFQPLRNVAFPRNGNTAERGKSGHLSESGSILPKEAREERTRSRYPCYPGTCGSVWHRCFGMPRMRYTPSGRIDAWSVAVV